MNANHRYHRLAISVLQVNLQSSANSAQQNHATNKGLKGLKNAHQEGKCIQFKTKRAIEVKIVKSLGKFGQHVRVSMIANFYKKIIHSLLLRTHCVQVYGLNTPQWTFSNLQNPLRPFSSPSHRVFDLSKHGIANILVPVQNSMSEAHQAFAYTCLFSRLKYPKLSQQFDAICMLE